MKDKIVLKELPEEVTDIKYEIYRAIKTFCIIMVIFCVGFILRKNYENMLENARYLKFYPTPTIFYQDFSNDKELSMPDFARDFASMSYGIVKDDRGKDKFLVVAKTPDTDTPIIDTKDYSLFTKNGYTFISDSNDELKAVQARLKTNDYGILKDPSVKKLVKKLDKNRDYTIFTTDAKYVDLPLDVDSKSLLGKVFEKGILQVYKTDDGIKFNGEVLYKNKIATAAAKIKRLAESFANRSIKIEDFDKEHLAFIAGVKDFDVWAKGFFMITNSLLDSRYNSTFELIETNFNSDVETDIIQKLNGNAVFYLFNDKKNMHPLLLMETKRDLTQSAQKYLGFLQLQNNSKMSEKEVNDTTFNVLSSKLYPYDLGFTTFSDKLFVLGHQDIVEKYAGTDKKDFLSKNCDIFLFANIDKTPLLKDNKGVWSPYKNLELEFKIGSSIYFEGKFEH